MRMRPCRPSAFQILAASLALLAALGASTSSAMACERVFFDEGTASEGLASELLSSSSPKAQRFLELLRDGLSKRYSRDPEIQQFVRDLSFLNLNETSQLYVANWAHLRTELRLSVVGDTMIINIPRAVVQTPGVGLKLGERPKGLNTAFSKLLAGLVESIRAEATRNPAIKKVDMIAGHVVNLPLIELLKQSGFSLRAPTHPAAHMPGMMGFGMEFGAGFTSFAPGRALSHQMGRLNVPRVQDSEVGRDWSLRFDVNRP